MLEAAAVIACILVVMVSADGMRDAGDFAPYFGHLLAHLFY